MSTEITSEKIEAVAKSLLGEFARGKGIDEKTITGDFDILASGLLDSGDFLGFLMDLEEQLGVPIDLSDASPAEFSSINGIIAILAPNGAG